jgi:hypothetical protein
MKSKSKSTRAVVIDENGPGIADMDISGSKVIDERIKINGHRMSNGKNIVRLYSGNISIEGHGLIKKKPAILYLNNGAMSGKIKGSKYISEDELEVIFVDGNKNTEEKEAEEKNKWLGDQVNDEDKNGMRSYGRLVVYENKLAAKAEKLILTKKEENDAGVDRILTEDGGLLADDVKTADDIKKEEELLRVRLNELSDGYEIQRIPGVPAVNTIVLVLNDVMVNVKPIMDGMDGVIITVKKSNQIIRQIIRGLKNVTTRILNGIETLSGNRVKIINERKRIRPQYFVIQDNKTPKEIELEEAEDILNEKQEKMEEIIDKDDVAEIPNLGEFIIACDVDGREFKGTLRALRDDSSNGKYILEGKLENAERLQDALANVTIFLKEEHRNRKVKKNGK